MKADTKTIEQVLHGDRQFVVPVFQRPYVWEREKQWEPLWEDVESTATRLAKTRAVGHAEGRDAARADASAAPHFLGAVVIEQSPTATGDVEIRQIVDGQQRLTTLQLLLRGVLDAFEAVGFDGPPRARVRKAVMNDLEVAGADKALKLVPRQAEREAFAVAMDGAKLSGEASVFADARQFFRESAKAFLRDEAVPGDPYAEEGVAVGDQRASMLAAALLGLVKLVVIDLEDEDDAQVIFEALNARNTPLSATDLVKNLLFLRAQAEHQDPVELYKTLWRRFDDDGDWWMEPVGIGHAQRARQDWLLGDWLIAQTGRGINVGRLYAEFRMWLANTSTNALVALTTLNEYADAYEKLHGRLPGATAAERAAFRRIENLNITAAMPILLWLFVQPESRVPSSERELAVRALESFVVRRMAAKYQTRAYGQAFVDVLKGAQKSASNPARGVIEMLDSGPHGYEWPTRAEIEQAFIENRYYGPGGINRDRLRLILGELDAWLQVRAHKAEKASFKYEKLTVEHVIPRSWRSYWPVDDFDPAVKVEKETRRDRSINRLGNLTLATGPLNSSMNNDPWAAKRQELTKHSKLELNAELIRLPEFDEDAIEERGRLLAARFDEIWPGPESDTWADPRRT